MGVVGLMMSQEANGLATSGLGIRVPATLIFVYEFLIQKGDQYLRTLVHGHGGWLAGLDFTPGGQSEKYVAAGDIANRQEKNHL